MLPEPPPLLRSLHTSPRLTMEAPLPELPNTLEDEQPRVKAPLDAAPEISAGPAAPTAGAGAAGPEIAGAAPSTPVAAAREPAVEASHREKAKLRATPSSAARAMQRSSAVGSVSPLAYVLLSGACLAMAAGALGTPGLVRHALAGGGRAGMAGVSRAASCWLPHLHPSLVCVHDLKPGAAQSPPDPSSPPAGDPRDVPQARRRPAGCSALAADAAQRRSAAGGVGGGGRAGCRGGGRLGRHGRRQLG